MKQKKSLLMISPLIALSGNLSYAAVPTEPLVWEISVLGDNTGNFLMGGISADGRVVAGYGGTESGYMQALAYNISDNRMTGLGTLKNDNTGESIANAISADGRVIVGRSDTDSGNTQAFAYYAGDSRLTGLGTLKNDNSGMSMASGISADGDVIVGRSVTDSGSIQAFAYYAGDSRMTGLGTLKNDNSGSSVANVISADGRVIAGFSVTERGDSEAFAYYAGDSRMTGLGTLISDNTGYSWATAISANGSVIGGYSYNDNGDSQAFVHYAGDSRMTALGTLRSDNSGESEIRRNGISADGRVIVGYSDTDSGDSQAFVHYNGDSRMTALGTLRSDNTGRSGANAISADGRVIIGYSDTDSGDSQAFVHYTGDSRMTGLGTLKSDNTGWSDTSVISADGSVIGGNAETDSTEIHAVVWKVKTPEKPLGPETPQPETPEPETPTLPPIVVIVDKDNSHKAMMDTANRGFEVLDLYQSALSSLGNSRCQLGRSDYCLGAFSQFDTVQRNHQIATGLFGSFRLPAESWIIGGAINFANQTQLIDNYDTRGSNKPGVGIFTRYQPNRDNSGLSVELSGTFLSQDITITRDKQDNTEAGQGDSNIQGYQTRLSTGYGFNLNDTTQIKPVAALSHSHISRDGYTETQHAEFAATYGRMGNTLTELMLGLEGQYALNQTLQFNSGIGTNIKLNGQRDAFTGQIDYIGAYAHSQGKERVVRPFSYVE